MKILKIGTIVYLVNKAWRKHSKVGSRLITAKITGYQNINGDIHPILKIGRIEVDPTTNDIFTDLDKAVEAIKTKK